MIKGVFSVHNRDKEYLEEIMDSEKVLIRELRKLIVFSAVVFLCLWKYEVVFAFLSGVLRVILPFLLGGAIAFMLNVPMSYLEKCLFSGKGRYGSGGRAARRCSLFLAVLLVSGVIAVLLFVVMPGLCRAFLRLGDSLQEFVPQLQEWARNRISNREALSFIEGLEFDQEDLAAFGIRYFQNGAVQAVGSAVTALRGVLHGLGVFVIAFAFACYVLLQKETLSRQAKKVLFAFVPEGRAEAILEVLELTGRTFTGFLTGQCLEALILGAMFVVTLAVLRFPYPLLLGIVIACTALVPVFGAFVGCAVGFVVVFITEPTRAAGFVFLFLVLQQIEGNFIYPHVVGNSVGLPPIWVLASVSVGGSLMGITGVLIFIPLASVSYALFREVVYLLLRKRGIRPEKL